MWPQAEIERITERLREAPVSNKATRDYVRMFSSASSDETPDKQGRITVPPKLREWASLGKDVVVIGAMNRLEIWDEAAWESLLRGAGGGVRRALGRGLPRHLTRHGSHQHAPASSSTTQLNSRRRRTRSRVRSLGRLAHLPRCQKATSQASGRGPGQANPAAHET